MKHSLRWTLVAILVLIITIGLVRTLSNRKDKANALQAQQSAQQAIPRIALNATDVAHVKNVTLNRNLDISGTLKAVNSAFIKARVAGELQELEVREGEYVKAGQVIARIDASEFQARLRQAQQQAESASAQVDIARRNFENNRSLVDKGFISKTALDTSLATLASAQANYRAAQAGAELAHKAVNDTVLRAPITGYIAQRLVQRGERVAVDARIVEIVNLDQMELQASVSATDSSEVKIGQTAQLTPEGAQNSIRAKVVRINPSTLNSNRSILIYLQVQPQSANLRQGLFVQGKLAIGTTQALAVPLTAIYTDKPQPYVQVLRNQQVVHQTVELGARGEVAEQPMVAVLRGVAENDNVLNARVGVLQAGTQITFEKGGL